MWLDLSRDQIVSLRAHVGDQLADPRSARGIRHDHSAVVTIAAAALLAGHLRPAAIAAYAGWFGQDALAVFGARWSDRHGTYIPPSESSFRRLLGGPGPGMLGHAVGTWLAGQTGAGTIDGRRARRLAACLAQAVR